MSNERNTEGNSSNDETRSWASYVDSALESLGQAISSAGQHHTAENTAEAMRKKLNSLAVAMEQGCQNVVERLSNKLENDQEAETSHQAMRIDAKRKFEEFLETTTQATTKMLSDMKAKLAEMDGPKSGTTLERNPKIEEEREWKLKFNDALKRLEEVISKKNRDALVENMDQWNAIKNPTERELMKAKVKSDLDEVAKKYSEYLNEMRCEIHKNLESTSQAHCYC